ncbi:MAG: YihY/virulence factor BrkB family protein [Chitinophagaceae bacterium]|nr:YihY/virulence factor BrkB family protein [Chitinophagaceae bacterium]
MSKIENKILNTRVVKTLQNKSRRIFIPGFGGVPLYDVIIFFISQMNKVGLNDRAASISFNFLMAIPAATIFLCTLIPYMPVSREITIELLDLTKSIAPNENTYGVVANFLNDFLNTPRKGLLSFGFIVAVFYASNAILGIMRSFNRSLHNYKERGFLKDRWTAIKLTTVLIVMIMITVTLLVFQGELFRWLMNTVEIKSEFVQQLIFSIRSVIIILLVLYSIGIIYKYAPTISKRWRIASPGAILATVLVILSTWLFSFYVNNFGSYNKVYGSIGTILILMFLIYLNSLILLIGYELNVCIHSLKAVADERNHADIKS